MKKVFCLLSVILLVVGALLVSGCGKDKFVGTWVAEAPDGLTDAVYKYTISKNGDDYILEIEDASVNGWIGKHDKGGDVPWLVKNNKITGLKLKGNSISKSLPMKEFVITYIEGSDTISAPAGIKLEVEFVRDDDGKEYDRLCKEREDRYHKAAAAK